MNLLDEYGYEPRESAVQKIIDTWKENKKELLDHFRKHPNWDENALAIVLKDSEYDRPFNKKALDDFYTWSVDRISEIKDTHLVKIEKPYSVRCDAVSDALYMLKELKKDMHKLGMYDVPRDDNGMYLEWVLTDEMKSIMKEEDDFLKEYDVIKRYDGKYISKEINRRLNSLQSALFECTYAKGNIITEELANRINSYFDVKAVAGQKLSRVIGKISKELGIDQYKDMREQENGTFRDMGYNREYAILCNEINPIKYKRITVISLNPLDYWTMSFGKNWSSCHTIDKENRRGCRSNTYQGCYSAGTESYMLDSASIVYYVIDEEYDGKDYWTQDKINRCMFHMNNNGSALVEGRVYPDGRDGGDEGLAGQFRSVMQSVVAQLWDLNNYWTVKHGTSNNEMYTETEGHHYADYVEYNDTNISLNKDFDHFNTVYIGSDAICPHCGGWHDYEDNISCCYEARDRIASCDRCGDDIYEDDDYIYCEDNGNYYCCSNCANRDDVYYCEDDGEYHVIDNLTYCEDDEYHLSDECFYDNYEDVYYHDEPEVTIKDGYERYYYASEDNAENDGWVKEYFTDKWMREDDLTWDSYEEVWFDSDNDEAICTYDGNYYATEDSVRNDDYVYCDDDYEWHKDDGDPLYIENDDVWYSSIEAAEDNGYVVAQDTDNWINKDDAYETIDGFFYEYDDDLIFDDDSDKYFNVDDAEVYIDDDNAFLTKEAAWKSGYIEVDGMWLDKSQVANDITKVVMFDDTIRVYDFNERFDFVESEVVA